jgi:hypothetical protein
MTCPGRQLGMNGVRRAERTSGDMAAQRAASVRHGDASWQRCSQLGKPCYAVGPVAKTETLYRFFDRMFTSSDDSASWLASPIGDAR